MNKISLNGVSGWLAVKENALDTIGLKPKTPPDTSWKLRMLYAEHSPIRSLVVRWTWKSLLSWVSVHFVRHHVGIDHYVRTQRTDRTGIDRNQLPQSSLVSHACVANAQALINISRKRLCWQASRETRDAWQLFLKKLKNTEPELASVCVTECVYRGFCPEIRCCGYADSMQFTRSREKYVQKCRSLRSNSLKRG